MAEQQKPVFVMSAEQIYLNLHRAGVEHAAPKVRLSAKGKEINQFIINSLCNDGKFITDFRSQAPESGDTAVVSGGGHAAKLQKETKLEMGIVLEIPDLTNLREQSLIANKNDLKKAQDKNRKLLKECKDMILAGINEYFSWFAGDGNGYGDSDLAYFIPDYSGGKVQVKNENGGWSLVGLKDEETYLSLYDPDISKTPSRAEVEKMTVDANHKVRIGFKVGYKIV